MLLRVSSTQFPGPLPLANGYPARARGFKWVGYRFTHNASSHGKIACVAFPVSLDLCLITAQIEDGRTEDKERGRKEGRVRAVSYWAVIYT